MTTDSLPVIMESSPSGAFAAVDLGASSGRVMLGRVSPAGVDLEELHRFRNGPISLPDGLFWDVLGLYQDVLIGLRAAVRRCAERAEPLLGVAIDSWAVDYGLLDHRGGLRGNPRHYRDPRAAGAVEKVHRLVDPARLYAMTGLQFLPFNTLYQLAAEPELEGCRALLIPDLLGYWLTGVQQAEETNASTTGLLNAITGEWDRGLVDALGIPVGLLPQVVPAGQVVGPLAPRVQQETGASRHVTLTTVGSHDTASAVVGVPAASDRFAYISCGTWGLVGVELTQPVLTPDSRAANFTNERGVDGTIRYLRNVMGLWLLSESLRTWQIEGQQVDLDNLLGAAARLPAGGAQIDPDDPAFLPPGDQPARIRAACHALGLPVPESPAQIVRCILDSLAAAFARAVEEVEKLSGRPVDVVHIVGGGSRNQLLCQLTCDALQREVIAGPVEATAIGNLLVQARTHGVLKGSLHDLRTVARSSLALTTYRPQERP